MSFMELLAQMPDDPAQRTPEQVLALFNAAAAELPQRPVRSTSPVAVMRKVSSSSRSTSDPSSSR